MSTVKSTDLLAITRPSGGDAGTYKVAVSDLPHAVPATEAAAGIVELATAAETTTGTDATRAVHPAGLKVELDKKVKKAGDTMTGNLTVPSLNGGPLAGFRNQIINGDFAIHQRGASGTLTDAAYTADRWLVYPRTSGQTVEWQSDKLATGDVAAPIVSYLRIKSAAGLNGWNFEHRIELSAVNNVSPFDAGTSWTLSFWAYTAFSLSLNPILQVGQTGLALGALASDPISSTQGSTAITQGSWNKYVFTFANIAAFANVPANVTNCRLRFAGPTDGTQTDFYISNVQLEPGPVATPFEHRPIGTELALCQRYFEVSSIEVAAPGSTGGSVDSYWFFKVNKRSSPTITLGVGHAGNLVRTDVDGTAIRSASGGTQVSFGIRPFADAEI